MIFNEEIMKTLPKNTAEVVYMRIKHNSKILRIFSINQYISFNGNDQHHIFECLSQLLN